MHVTSIWRYPVKTMIGATVPSAHLDPIGIRGDREWAIRDLTTGAIANTRTLGVLMQFAAAPAGDGVVVTLPDGRTVHSADADADAALSDAAGRSVSLVPRPPAEEVGFYRRLPSTAADPMAELREIFAREDDEPLPDFTKFPPSVVEYETPPGALYDCYPLLVMTTSALRSMQEAVPASVIDVRRFRPSLVVDTGDEPGHPEYGWTGRRFAVGGAVIEVINDCPRCAAITKQVTPDVPQDRAILRHVVKDLGQAVGAYAAVVQPGPVHEGDEFRPL